MITVTGETIRDIKIQIDEQFGIEEKMLSPDPTRCTCSWTNNPAIRTAPQIFRVGHYCPFHK